MANIRKHLSGADMWQEVRMIEQEALHRKVDGAAGVHYTVITSLSVVPSVWTWW